MSGANHEEKKLDGPDFAQGVALADIEEGGMILGHVTGDAVLFARGFKSLSDTWADTTTSHGRLMRAWRTGGVRNAT